MAATTLVISSAVGLVGSWYSISLNQPFSNQQVPQKVKNIAKLIMFGSLALMLALVFDYYTSIPQILCLGIMGVGYLVLGKGCYRRYCMKNDGSPKSQAFPLVENYWASFRK